MNATKQIKNQKPGTANPGIESQDSKKNCSKSADLFGGVTGKVKSLLATLLLTVLICSHAVGQIEAPDLVPQKRALVEIGASMERDENDSIASENNVLNNTNFRFGLTKNFELQVAFSILDYQEHLKESDVILYHDRGFSGVGVGGKFFVCEEKGKLPNISMVARLQLPYFGDKNFRPAFLAPSFMVLCQHTLSDRFSLSYNLGAEWDGASCQSVLVYNTSLGITISDNTSTFIEVTGNFAENQGVEGTFDGTFTSDHTLDAGVTCVPNKYFQLDLSGGVGLNQLAPDYFLAAVLTIKIPSKNQF